MAEATVFGHRFVTLPGLVEELITLEKEGAIYVHFWDEGYQNFRYYRIQFLPSEIYQFVEAHVAKQKFDEARRLGATFEEALLAIGDPKIADRVRSYGDYGHTRLRDGSVADLRGCADSFYPEQLHALLMARCPDRYQPQPEIQPPDRPSLIIQVLDSFPVLARFMARRGNDRPPLTVENEYDVQHLLFIALRAVFADTRLEDPTPKHAGASKRIDLVVPSAGTVVETKLVRDRAHARAVGDELKVDIESYHAHAACKHMLALVYDPDHHITDPTALMNELSGFRVKGNSKFEVKVLVRS